MMMLRHLLPISLTTTFVLTVPPAPVSAQVVEQTIRVMPDAGGGLQLPLGAGGQRQFKTGSGRIRGRVMANDAAAPIRRAQVRITGQDIAPKAVTTDAEGRFEFRDLPAGRFTLQASKTGFVTVQYGQTRPFEQGKAIELADKQALDNADIAMPRGGVISGRIVDEFGDAVPDAAVTAMRQTWSNGRRRLVPSPARIAQTNDLGQFRIFGLPPGDYFVSASVRGGGNPLLDIEPGMVTGTFTTAVLAGGPTASEQRSGYASTYYPGTSSVGEAQKIALAAGQELSGADFQMLPVRLAKVTGVVIGADGKPAEGAAVMLMPSQRDLAGLLAPTSARSARDGSFTLNSVPPGDYMLQVRSIQTITTSSQGDSVMVFRATAIGGGDAEFSSTPLSVAGEDVANLVLVTGKGATATGRVIFDGAPPASMAGIRLTSVAIDPEAGAPGGGATSVKDDGTFEMKGLAGPRFIRVAGAPSGWTLKSVKLNGADITDTGAEFKPGDSVSGLEVELTPRAASVSGTVSDVDGSAVKDYTVVIFAENAELWRMPLTRWVHGARPDQEGRFRVPSLPAGAYLAVAVEYLPQGEWGDPDVLDRLRAKATRVTVADGAAQTVDLRLTKEY